MRTEKRGIAFNMQMQAFSDKSLVTC